jgi:CCR4-NOT transcriptional regulation complex NOT5 subunit
MASKKKAASAGAALWGLKESPAVQRLIQDEELRANILQAYSSTRDAYGRLSNGKKPTKQIFDDKKLQRDVSKAAASLRDAGTALREGPKRKRGFGLGRLLLLTLVGAGAALGASEGLRKKVLDALFGAEEEFEYTSATTTTTPVTDVSTTPSGVATTPVTGATTTPPTTDTTTTGL